MIEPDRVWTNAHARVGDVLLLTKPLGTGIVATAIKRDRVPADLASVAIASMRTLNKVAADVLRRFARAVHACTDVTGFGLAGHAVEVADASGVTLALDPRRIPVFDGVRAIALDHQPGGTRTNREHFGRRVAIDAAATGDPTTLPLLFDPQTSGGLLAALDPDSSIRCPRGAAVGWPAGGARGSGPRASVAPRVHPASSSRVELTQPGGAKMRPAGVVVWFRLRPNAALGGTSAPRAMKQIGD